MLLSGLILVESTLHHLVVFVVAIWFIIFSFLKKVPSMMTWLPISEHNIWKDHPVSYSRWVCMNWVDLDDLMHRVP